MGNILITNATKGNIKISITGRLTPLVGIFGPNTIPYQFKMRYGQGTTISITSVDGSKGQTFGPAGTPQGIPMNSKLTVSDATDGGYGIVVEDLGQSSMYGSVTDINDTNKNDYAMSQEAEAVNKPLEPVKKPQEPTGVKKPSQPPGDKPSGNNSLYFLIGISILIFLLMLVIIVKLIKRKKK